jgi:hypothetical protein
MVELTEEVSSSIYLLRTRCLFAAETQDTNSVDGFRRQDVLGGDAVFGRLVFVLCSSCDEWCL